MLPSSVGSLQVHTLMCNDAHVYTHMYTLGPLLTDSSPVPFLLSIFLDVQTSQPSFCLRPPEELFACSLFLSVVFKASILSVLQPPRVETNRPLHSQHK